MTRSSSLKLLTFDNELISDLILQELAPPALAALCLVCQTTRAHAEAHLYRRIDWTWSLHMTPPILAFLRTILGRRSLAGHIRTIYIRGYDALGPFYDTGQPPLSIEGYESVMPDIESAVRSLHVAMEARWLEDARALKFTALLTIILSQACKLRWLHLESNVTKQPMLLASFMHACLDDSSTLQQRFGMLHKVTHNVQIAGREQIDGSDTASILAYFYLPAIKVLQLGLDNPASFSWPRSVPRCHTLRSLSLTLINERHLHHILAVCPSLESFEWIWFHRFQSAVANPVHIDLQGLSNALHLVRNTLRALVVRALPDPGPALVMPDQLVLEGMLSLSTMTHLESIKMPLEFLLPQSHDDSIQNVGYVIPTACRSLDLHGDLDEFDALTISEQQLLPPFTAWLEHWPTTHPFLRRLRLSTCHIHESDHEVVQDTLLHYTSHDLSIYIIHWEPGIDHTQFPPLPMSV